MSATRPTGNLFVLAAVLAASFALPAIAAEQVPGATLQAYQDLFATSQKEKKGLMFFVRGQQVGGAVVRVLGNDAVEIRNQTYGRIIIRADRIDAVAIN